MIRTTRKWQCQICKHLVRKNRRFAHVRMHEDEGWRPGESDVAEWIIAGKPLYWVVRPVEYDLPSDGGLGFSFMKKQVIPDFKDPNADYLTRLRIIDTPWFGIYVHWFHLPDSQPEHDHPFNFVSFILRGGYTEQINSTITVRRTGRAHLVRLGDTHRVLRLSGKPITLVFHGRRLQKWGFYTNSGYYPHKEYIKMMSGKTSEEYYR